MSIVPTFHGAENGASPDNPVGRRSATVSTIELRAPDADPMHIAESAVRRALAVVPDAVLVPPSGDDPAREVILPGGATVHISVATETRSTGGSPGTAVLTARVSASAGYGDELVQLLLAAVRAAPLTHAELQELRVRMPLTRGLGVALPGAALSSAAPLLVCRTAAEVPVMVETFIALGVEQRQLTVLAVSDNPGLERVTAHLNEVGIPVWAGPQVADALLDHAGRAREAGRTPFLTDDGGYTLPTLLSEIPGLAAGYGGLVERSRNPVIALDPVPEQIPLPIFAAGQSRLVSTVEGQCAARAVLRRLQALELDDGSPVLVVGFGHVGAELAEQLRARRLRVAVHDTDPVALVTAHERGFVTARSVPRLLAEHRPALLVATTGRVSVHGDHLEQHLHRDIHLLSAIPGRGEFALDEFAEAAVGQEDLGATGVRFHFGTGHTATVLRGVSPEHQRAFPLPDRCTDLATAAAVIGTVLLASRDHHFGPGHNVARTNAALAASGLADHYYQLYGPAARPTRGER
ncbi:hypothetical protein GCM10012275_16480 [Longimycelium tulufanense]|uniref:S-adenosyl-L-homocysteine hydrolase NAD binding domain-containing protein n=1 Tax=Longimycelium tulufanense TaxID=907463 RepID=A0A8J3FVN3_9PSEU|nr:hypothetical protein [Longimycelium tulufanense]GGM46173.1 hypothetical protein GCM10012275_16480 [Longimycelium tulufanense]